MLSLPFPPNTRRNRKGTLPTRRGVGIVNKPDKETSRLMNTYWANFAKNGNGLAQWPVYTLEDSHILEFRADATAASIPEAKPERLDVTEKAALARRR